MNHDTLLVLLILRAIEKLTTNQEWASEHSIIRIVSAEALNKHKWAVPTEYIEQRITLEGTSGDIHCSFFNNTANWKLSDRGYDTLSELNRA